MTRPAKKQVMPVVTGRRNDTIGALEELASWATTQMVEAQRGRTLEDAGRASAYARVIVQIREMQRARDLVGGGS